MKQFQQVLLFALVVATIMLAKADDSDNQKCIKYAEELGVSDKFLSHCGKFNLASLDPNSNCKKVCNKYNKNFGFQVKQDCCCATYSKQIDREEPATVALDLNQ